MTKDDEDGCQGDCNPFIARCGARFCSYEDAAHHSKGCTAPVMSQRPDDGLTLLHTQLEALEQEMRDRLLICQQVAMSPDITATESAMVLSGSSGIQKWADTLRSIRGQ